MYTVIPFEKGQQPWSSNYLLQELHAWLDCRELEAARSSELHPFRQVNHDTLRQDLGSNQERIQNMPLAESKHLSPQTSYLNINSLQPINIVNSLATRQLHTYVQKDTMHAALMPMSQVWVPQL